MNGLVPRGRVLPIAGVVLALALVLLGVRLTVQPDAPTAAAADGPALENTELVLADLEPSGLPTTAQLVSTITARTGERRVVEDPASTVNVGYLDRRGSPDVATGVVLVEVGGPGTTTAVTEATFDKPLPVAVHAEYTLDGAVVAPAAVLGARGSLTVRYTVTNTTAEQTTVRYDDADGVTRSRDVPVFVPFAGTLDVLLPSGLELVDAGAAAVTTDADGRTLLRYSLLLAPPLGSFQKDVTVKVRAVDGATPQAVLAVVPATSVTDAATGFSADALAGAVEGNTELASGLGELGEQTGLLADGAAAVADGADALADGAAVLADQVGGPLLAGSRTLEQGAGAVASGVDEVAIGLGEAGAGAGDVASGLGQLSSGLTELSAGLDLLAGADGLPRAADAAAELTEGAALIADGVGSADDPPWPPRALLPEPPDLGSLPPDLTPDELADLIRKYLPDLTTLPDEIPPPTLVQSVRLLERATTVLVDVAGALVLSVKQQQEALLQAQAASTAAATQSEALVAEVCGPTATLTAEQCAVLEVVGAQSRTASAAVATATKAAAAQAVLAGGLGLGVRGLDAALGLLETAVLDLSAALSSGDTSAPGLVEGLALLRQGLDTSVGAAQGLAAGAQTATGGATELTDGADALAGGLDDAASGAAALADGANRLADGAAANVDGVTSLAEGSDGLAGGASETAAVTGDVAAGVEALKTEGIDEVAAAVAAAVDEPALASAWLAATDARAANALPYGPPDGAVGHAAYRLTMPSTKPGGTPPWQWWLLAVGGMVVVGLGVQRRLTG
jgi:putative membrane protein